jgi:hypothetical protein
MALACLLQHVLLTLHQAIEFRAKFADRLSAKGPILARFCCQNAIGLLRFDDLLLEALTHVADHRSSPFPF